MQPVEPLVPVRIELRLGEKLFPAKAGTVTFLPVAKHHEPKTVEFDGRSLLEVRLPAGSKWRVTASLPGLWTPINELEVGPVGSGLLQRLFLWPASTLAGQLRIPKGKIMPEDLALRLDLALHRSTISRTLEVSCPVDEKGKFSCPLPAGRIDLRLSSAGFVPRYWWRMRTVGDETTKLGVFELRPGASVAGWVEVDGGPLSERCLAKLRPPATSGGDPRMALRVAKTEHETKVGKDGFFQFDGIGEGIYQLEVAQPGFAPARIASIEVWPESETRLADPLVLHRPLEVELRIAPPVDWLGKRWKVHLAPAFDFDQSFDVERGFEGLADGLGRVKIPGQTPGRFMLKIADSAGNTLYHNLSLYIDGPHNSQQEIRLDLVELQGTVSYRDEPVAATLWFGGRHGSPRVFFQSNSDGRFEGVLPRGGTWIVDIEGVEPEISTHAKVAVKPSRRGEAFVDLELPDAEVFGRVMNEEGLPVVGARVSISSIVGTMQPAETDEDGRFEVRAVPRGRVQLAASKDYPAGEETSGRRQLEVADERSHGPIDLVLRPTQEFSGRIVSQRGPVPGAVVTWFCHQPPLPFGGRGRSDLDGRFNGPINSRCKSVRAIVRPPGHALLSLVVSASEPPAAINVPTVGGTLRLDVPYTSAEMLEENIVMVAHQNGLPIPFFTLHRWALGRGSRFLTELDSGAQLEIPQLAAGQYRVCLTTRRVVADLPDFSDACATGYLTAGATLSLRLPKL